MTYRIAHSTSEDERVRVLHVDDDSDFSDVTAAFLEQEHDRLSVVSASTPQEGLARLAEDSFDCIVSDYNMPGTNGLEFLEAVRARGVDVPFVLFTGRGSEEIASEAISAGVSDYLQKEPGIGQYAVLANRVVNAVEQYQSRVALEASQKRLSLFIEQSPLGVLERDKEGVIIRANSAAEEILGYTEAELVGRGWGQLVSPSSHESVEAVISSLLKVEGGFHSINENVRKDGEHIVCEWHNRVVTDENEEVVAVFSQFQDITDRRQREERLTRTTARLESLFENSPDMINVHDAEGTIVDVNPLLCKGTGYSEAELVGMKVWKLDRNLETRAVRALWDDMVPGDRDTVESEYTCRDGSTVPVEVNVSCLDLDGERQFMAISRDITERAERERQLSEQNERLAEFTSVVSHDLRSPLAVAEGNLQLAKRECESEYLGTVQAAHVRMRTLIDDLLRLAREGSSATEMDSLSLTATFERAWETVETADAQFVVDTDLTIRADASQFRRLLENLIRNSVEHGSTGRRAASDDEEEHGYGGDVTITVGPLDNQDGFYLVDDGPGVPEADREDVFKVGYSSGSSGSGLGLGIVKQIVDSHGWTVRVVDSPDGGARFEFSGVDVVE